MNRYTASSDVSQLASTRVDSSSSTHSSQSSIVNSTASPLLVRRRGSCSREGECRHLQIVGRDGGGGGSEAGGTQAQDVIKLLPLALDVELGLCVGWLVEDPHAASASVSRDLGIAGESSHLVHSNARIVVCGERD